MSLWALRLSLATYSSSKLRGFTIWAAGIAVCLILAFFALRVDIIN